ncbi:inorganic phosphate transporter [Desulfovibrio subterraneus]|uniref:Phosphate transporter n=1 Tax=Desulfovibrio subterraneus TaxID=2718620 RepID=A0A7J0BHR5_9BACT|nr:inorganic phosphate transporter [Desulfovibrio subterraneus]GFM33227.1 anion permease [Desulfovibrio subterraneus]
MSLFFLSSGMFLGWSLGANDAANVFGTAVGSRMVKFHTAAVCCSLFVLLGAVISGAGASETLGKLGAVNALAGAFVVAFSAALSVYMMIRARYPASTSQAIVGAILGWNFFSDTPTDTIELTKIVMTWVACPTLAAITAIAFYKLAAFVIPSCRISLFKLDKWTRYGLIAVGAFGSYSLGANNIANVVGVFVPVSPFGNVTLFGVIPLSSAQLLFLIGGIAIAVGVFTYSRHTMQTIGGGIFKLSPVMALVAVWAHSVVLFVFSSQSLEAFLRGMGLPTLPLVPVSSSQAIVGAVVGMGLLKGGRGIRWRTVGGIACGWVTTPIIAGIVCFICLSILQNVFQQTVYDDTLAQKQPAIIETVAPETVGTRHELPGAVTVQPSEPRS